MKVEAVDLFCGIGGLTYGVKSSGIDVLAGIDIDATCEYAYTENNHVPFVHKSIEEVTASEMATLYGEDSIRILMGCAPCQPFSRYTYRYKKEGHKDSRWGLLFEFARLIEGVKPDVVSMENVPILRNTSVFREFLKTLVQTGYHVSWGIVNSADYGVPQNRKRLVLLASRYGEISLVDPTCAAGSHVTVRDAISHLAELEDGEISDDDPMHRASGLTKINQARIRQSVPGGTWKDWDESLLLNCHRKKTGKTYKSVYGRMEWDKPAPTITTQFYGYGNGRFGHPEQDRAISLREGAILQSFPDDYKFFATKGEMTNRQIGTHIGNAVPILLAEAIGRSIIEHLEERRDTIVRWRADSPHVKR